MTEEEIWNEYFIPGTDVIKNKFNITDKEELKEVEKDLTRKSLSYLYLKPVKGNFDINHLKEIHKEIFKSIYYFAGEFRNCSLQKDDHIFCYPEYIVPQLTDILERMNNEFTMDIISIEDFAFKLGKYYYELITVHPFREGNGRTIRVFIRDFVVEKSKNKSCGPLDLDYTKIDGKNLLMGTAKRYVFPSMIEVEFMNSLVKLEKEKVENTNRI